ncbi:hypothetical protein EC968_000927 [Mortierella alpina]|nr:hypothetical protein EC968_000927 [Mortierella alpina]
MQPVTHSRGHDHGLDHDQAETPRPVSASSTSSRSSFSSIASPGLNRGLHRRRGSGSSDHSARSPSPGVSSAAAIPNPYLTTFNPEQLRVAADKQDACASLGPDPSAEFEVRVIGNRPNGPRTRSSAPSPSPSPPPAATNNGTLGDSEACKPVADRPDVPHPDETKSLNRREESMPPGSTLPPTAAAATPPPAVAAAATATATPINAPAKPARLRSLDILRGITIIVMILVNTQGADPFEQLEHSEWFGYTLADWVFPNFIFMVGVAVAIVFSPNKLAALQPQGESARAPSSSFWKRHRLRVRLTLKILKRSVLLFGIGLILSALDLIGRPKEERWLRIPGVLQRIAFCYLVLATTVLWAPPRIDTSSSSTRMPPVLALLSSPPSSSSSLSSPPPSLSPSSSSSATATAAVSSPSTSRSPHKDVASTSTFQRRFLPSRHVLITLPTTCVVLWFILTFSVRSTATEPIANCDYPSAFVDPEGTVLPGSPPLRGQLSPQWCTAQAFLDTVLFARDQDVNNPVFDSEGSLGNLMAIVTAWFGYMVGTVIMEQQRGQKAIDKRMADSMMPSSLTRECDLRRPRALLSDQGTMMKKEDTEAGTGDEGAAAASVSEPKPDEESMKTVAAGNSISPVGENYADVAVLRTSSIRSGTRAAISSPLSSSSASSSPSSSSRPRKPCEPQPPRQQQQQQQDHHLHHHYSLQELLDSQRRESLLAHLGEWFMFGISVMFAGMALDWVIPICKGLWTPSYTLYSAGISTNALCILMYIYDVPPLPSLAVAAATTLSFPPASSSPTVRAMNNSGGSNSRSKSHGRRNRVKAFGQRLLQALRRGLVLTGAGCTRLLIFYGRNPTLIYILSEVVKLILDKIPVHNSKYDWIASAWAHIFFYSFITFMPAPWASLVFSTVYILLFAPLMWYLDRKGIYLRV